MPKRRARRGNPSRPDFTPVANPKAAEGAREIAKSGAWGTHADGRFRRARTTQAALLRERREQRFD